MIRKASLALIVAHLTFAATALAGDPAILSTTRELAKQGLVAYDAGRFAEAVDKLSKAYAVVHLPTLGVATARALVKTGKLVAASELYMEAAHIPRDKSWQASQQDAQQDAERERSELLPRIPRVTIGVTGAELAEVAVSIDGVAVPQTLNDAEQMVDPGERHIEGTCRNELAKRTVNVKEGERTRVMLEFTPGAAVSASAGEAQLPTQARPGTPPTAQPNAGQQKSGSGQKLLGWTAVTAGGVGLAVGAVSGLWALSKRSALLDTGKCAPNELSCPKDQASDVDRYNSLRTVSTVGFIAGGVLAATGVTLLLTLPKQESKPSVGLWIGPSSAGVYGGF